MMNEKYNISLNEIMIIITKNTFTLSMESFCLCAFRDILKICKYPQKLTVYEGLGGLDFS